MKQRERVLTERLPDGAARHACEEERDGAREQRDHFGRRQQREPSSVCIAGVAPLLLLTARRARVQLLEQSVQQEGRELNRRTLDDVRVAHATQGSSARRRRGRLERLPSPSRSHSTGRQAADGRHHARSETPAPAVHAVVRVEAPLEFVVVQLYRLPVARIATRSCSQHAT